MRLDDYLEKDGKRVWLTSEEMQLLIDEHETPLQYVAFKLGGRGGLRREEIVSVTPNDFRHGPEGFVRVWADYAKRDKYREAPIPNELENYVDGLTSDQAPDKAVIERSGATVYRWVTHAAKRLQARTGDKGWSFVGPHDLRRSWGGHLLWNCGVSPMSVMQFGGWEDWQTFKRHYMGEMTPEARDRERSKIDFMGGQPEESNVMFEPSNSAPKAVYRG